MPKVTVYVPAPDWRELEAEGHEPAEWVREIVRKLLAEKKSRKEAEA